MRISVIIPTYNRKQYLQEMLAYLGDQTYPKELFDVIVADDGSDDGTADVLKTAPFPLKYVRQENQGDAAARNLGAENSDAELLVFLDDDVLIMPDYLMSIAQTHQTAENLIVVGTEILWLDEQNLPQKSNNSVSPSAPGSVVPHNFVDVCSNNMSVRRKAYFDIGGMHGLDFQGSDIWCDVEFSYRAHQRGFKFMRSKNAICFHRDYTSVNLNAKKKRMYKAAYRSVELFQNYPELIRYLPMFEDKTAVLWHKDPMQLIGRKIFRQIISSKLPLVGLEQTVKLSKNIPQTSSILKMLERWIVGGYIYKGFHAGLRELNEK